MVVPGRRQGMRQTGAVRLGASREAPLPHGPPSWCSGLLAARRLRFPVPLSNAPRSGAFRGAPSHGMSWHGAPRIPHGGPRIVCTLCNILLYVVVWICVQRIIIIFFNGTNTPHPL